MRSALTKKIDLFVRYIPYATKNYGKVSKQILGDFWTFSWKSA